MATFSTTYNPDQHGPSGPERGAEDYNLLEESCEFPRNTIAGIIERADASTRSMDGFRAEVQRLTEDALAASEAEIEFRVGQMWESHDGKHAWEVDHLYSDGRAVLRSVASNWATTVPLTLAQWNDRNQWRLRVLAASEVGD